MFDFLLKQQPQQQPQQQAAAEPTAIPPIGTVHMQEDPRHIEAHMQDTTINDTLVVVRARRREIELIKLGRVAISAPSPQAHLAAAMRLADTGESAIPAVKELSELRREDEALAKQEAVLQEAIGASTQRVERALNSEFSATLENEHSTLRTEYIATLRRLGELELEERTLMTRGAKLGFSDVRLRGRISWDHLGELDDPNSAISRRLNDLGA